MAQGSAMPPLLRIKRSSQSGQKVMTAAWVAVYWESCTQVYLFAGAHLDLTTMAAGDTIDVRIRKVMASGLGWVVTDQIQYTGAQPAGHPIAQISGIPDVYGVEISMRQTAGVLRTIPCEFFDAKRIGL
jgi:hypothetical protein